MRPTCHYLITLALLCLIVVGRGQEGNYKFDNYGNQSMLLNGNVTGSATDLGLAFYNPARLVFVDKPSFVIAGKAYEWSQFTFEDVFETEIDLNTSNFNGIPSIVAGTFNLKFLPKHKFAYSILSRYRSDIPLNYSSGIQDNPEIDPIENEVRRVTNISFQNKLREEWYGITWAYPVNEKLGVGASLYGSIYTNRGSSDIDVSAERQDSSTAGYSSELNYEQKTYGLFLKMGVAWQLSNIEIGANLNLPFIPVETRASLQYQENLFGLGPGEDFFAYEDLEDLDNKRRTATSISVGAGIPVGKSTIHLNSSWYSKVKPYQRIELPALDSAGQRFNLEPFEEEFRSVINFGAGADIYISPSVKFIMSFSSDFSATVSSINLFDVVNQSQGKVNLLNDFWHYGFGTDLSLKWGQIVLGATYSRTKSPFEEDIDIPDDILDDGALDFVNYITFERWRFIIGLEIPILQGKLNEQSEE
ncbi:MAG: hypothetical protein JSV59_05445 [Flavobacteriaceae bacterium]|nr:MAG: hypothetical protein JSV59_05445 [Flavobacteriaceae bacterium]